MLFATSYCILACLHSDRVDNRGKLFAMLARQESRLYTPFLADEGRMCKTAGGASSVHRFLCVYIWTEIFLNRASVDVIFFKDKNRVCRNTQVRGDKT